MTKETQQVTVNGELTDGAKKALVGVLGEVLVRNNAAVRALEARLCDQEIPASDLTEAEVAEADRVAPAHRNMLRGLLSAFTLGHTGTVGERGAPSQDGNHPHHRS